MLIFKKKEVILNISLVVMFVKHLKGMNETQ